MKVCFRGVAVGFRGVLKGDLKGCERVWFAESRRRRLVGGAGDMVGGLMLVSVELHRRFVSGGISHGRRLPPDGEVVLTVKSKRLGLPAPLILS